jgi:hypothetical protein
MGKKQMEELREILVEMALLWNVYQFQETKDFIEDVVRVLSECHPSFVEDVKGRLFGKKQVKTLQQSINTLTEENPS